MYCLTFYFILIFTTFDALLQVLELFKLIKRESKSFSFYISKKILIFKFGFINFFVKIFEKKEI
jgi:hypothetical protein